MSTIHQHYASLWFNTALVPGRSVYNYGPHEGVCAVVSGDDFGWGLLSAEEKEHSEAWFEALDMNDEDTMQLLIKSGFHINRLNQVSGNDGIESTPGGTSVGRIFPNRPSAEPDAR